MSTTASDLLRADHRRIEDLIDRLLAAAKQLSREMLPRLVEVLEPLRRLAAEHFEKEERVLYPHLRPGLPGLLAEMDEQHANARQMEASLLETLEAAQGAPTERQLGDLRRFAIELHDAIQHHIVAEEDQLLRLADQRLTPAEQQRLAEAMRAIGGLHQRGGD